MITNVSLSKLIDAKIQAIKLKYNNLAYNFNTIIKENQVSIKFNIIGQSGNYFKTLKL